VMCRAPVGAHWGSDAPSDHALSLAEHQYHAANWDNA
jgi:hypothetical protein